MKFTKLSEEKIGTALHPSAEFKTNFKAYEDAFLTEAEAHGYPKELWSPTYAMAIVHRAFMDGSMPMVLPTVTPMTKDAYAGARVHKTVSDDFARDLPMFSQPVYVITKAESWWPGDKAFLAHNAESFMQFCLYRSACRDQGVLELPKRGRPKSGAVTVQHSGDYQIWLQQCKDYKTELERLKQNYLTALAEYTALKNQGAPKREA